MPEHPPPPPTGGKKALLNWIKDTVNGDYKDKEKVKAIQKALE